MGTWLMSKVRWQFDIWCWSTSLPRLRKSLRRRTFRTHWQPGAEERDSPGWEFSEIFQKFPQDHLQMVQPWLTTLLFQDNSQNRQQPSRNMDDIAHNGVWKTWPEEGRLKQGKQIPSQNPTQLSLRLCCMARGRRSSGQPPCLEGGPALA